MQDTIIVLISIISFFLGILLFAFGYKYLEKHKLIENTTILANIKNNFKLILIFLIPSILYELALFICVIYFGISFVRIISDLINNINPFIINENLSIIVIIITAIVMFAFFNIIYNLSFINNNSKIYKKIHNYFYYFYNDQDGIKYNSKYYRFLFMIKCRALLPLFFITLLMTILIK